jgi:TP901 family phage tail tape measure protein/lambda family phage tail tape measure protein
MSGEKEQLGIEINLSADGVSQSTQSIEDIADAMRVADEATKSFQSTISSLNGNGFASIATRFEKMEESMATNSTYLRDELNLLKDTLNQVKEVGGELGGVTSSIQSVGSTAKRSFEDASNSAHKFGGIMHTIQTAFKYGVVYGGIYELLTQLKEAIDLSGTLSQDTTRLNISGIGASRQQFDSVTSTAAQTYGVSQATEAQAAMEAVALGAKNLTDIQNQLTAANQVAIITQQGVTQALDETDSLYDKFKDQGETVASVSDKIAASSKDLSVNFKENASQLEASAQAAKDAGLSLNQFLAIYTTIASSGNSGLIQQLPQLINAIASPTQNQINLFNELGIAYGQQALKAEGVYGFIEQVQEKTKGNKALISEALGDGSAGRLSDLYQTLIGNLDKYNQKMGELKSSTGDALNFSNQLLSGTQQQYQKLTQSILDVAAAVTNAYAPAAGALAKTLNGVLNTGSYTSLTGLSQLSSDLSETITYIDGLGPAYQALTPYVNQASDAIKKFNDNVAQKEENNLQSQTNYLKGQYLNQSSDSLKNLNGGQYAYNIGGSQNDDYLGKTNNYDDFQRQSLESANQVSQSVQQQVKPIVIPIKAAPISPGNAVLPPQQSAAQEQIDKDQNTAALSLVQSQQQQIATFGQTADAVMRYRTTLGDLAGAQESVKQTLIKQADVIELQQGLQTAADSFADNFSQFASGAESAKDAFRSFAQSTIEQLTELIIKMYAFKAADSFFGGFGSVGSSAGGSVSQSAISSGSSGFFGSTGPALGPAETQSLGSVRSLQAPANSPSFGSSPPVTIQTTVNVTTQGSNLSSKDIGNQTAAKVSQQIRGIVISEIARQKKAGGAL